MAQDQINELFNISEIEANADKALAIVRAKVAEINKLQQDILKADSVNSNVNNGKQAAADVTTLSNAVKEYTAATKQALAARSADGQYIAELEAKIDRLTTKLKEKVVVTASSNKEAKLEAIVASELTSAYEKLDAQHKLAIRRYQDMAASGKASAAQITAQKDAANALGDQLSKIDQATGNYRRNVGNYTSAWNGLGNSINQITREMPNFAQSFQLGLLSISNNLPILQDELGRARERIAALKAEGKDAPSLFSQIAGAIFSWQTALTVVITLSLKYSDAILDVLTSTTEAEKAQRAYNKALDESIKSESGSINTLLLAKTAINDNTKSRAEQGLALLEAQKMFPAYLGGLSLEKSSLDEINKSLDEQIQLRIDNAMQVAQNQLLVKSTEDLIKAQLHLNDSIGFWEKYFSDIKSVGIQYQFLTDNAKKLWDAEAKKNQEMGYGNTISDAMAVRIKDISDKEKERTNILKLSVTQEEKQIETINNQIAVLQDRRKEHEQDVKGFETINTNNKRERAGIDLIIQGLNSQIDALQKLRQEKINSQFSTLRLEKDPLKLELDNVNARIKIAKDGSAEQIKLQKQSADITLKMQIRKLNEEYNYGTSYQKINLASNAEYMAKIENAELEHKARLSEIDQRADKKNNKKKQKEDEYKQLVSISQQMFDQLNDLEKDHVEQRVAAENDLLEKLKSGIITTEQYQKEKALIIKSSEEDILNAKIAFLQQEMTALGISDAESRKIIEKLTDFQKEQLAKRFAADEEYWKQSSDFEQAALKSSTKYWTDSLNWAKNQIDKRLEEEKQLRIQIAQEVNKVIFNLIDEQEKKELASLERRKTALTLSYDQKKQAVSDAAVSDEEKAKRRAVLDAEEIQRQQEIDNKIREIKRKQAIFDKVQALATIAINTAVAASNPTNLALGGLITPLILALGAAQAAVVLSTPLPQYAKGKKKSDSYEGLAIAGEAGTELLIDKEGKSVLLDKPTLIHTRKGDTILSNAQLKKAVDGNNTTVFNSDNTDVVDALNYNIEKLNKTIKNQGERVVPIDQTRYFDLKRFASR